MIQYNFEGRVAVVTGGAQGIGLAVVQRLLAGGARVAIWDANTAALDEARTLLRSDAVQTVRVDITSLAEVEAAVRETEGTSGPIAMLVHSAGIAGANAPVADYAPAEWQKVLDVNLTGGFLVLQQAARHLVIRRQP